MKKSALLLGIVVLLFCLSACGPGDFVSSAGLAPASAPESAAESTIESAVESAIESPVESTSHEVEPQPTVTPTPDPVSSEEDWVYDPLVSSPYYSGQAGLLEDIQRDSPRLPQRFYWINEETVRSAWGIGEYLSATCQERVAHFDFSRQGEDGAWEEFDLFLSMTPEAEMPEFDGYLRYSYTPIGEWESADGHPGFELMAVETERRPIETHRHSGWLVPFSPASKDPNATPTPVPTLPPIPQTVRVRWQAGEFCAMMQLPQSGLDAFWENAEQLLVEVEAQPREPRDEEAQMAVASVPSDSELTESP